MEPLPRLSRMLLVFYILLFLYFLSTGNTIPVSRSTIKTIPGFPGTLPFNLETGYVSVGDEDDLQLFYYFIESETDPFNDPLLIWLNGGPGVSSLSGLAYGNGPLSFNYPVTNEEESPSFILNPYSWTKFANIIYLDQPAGTGFSYATTSRGYYASNTKSAIDAYDFVRKWFLDHPKFAKNPLYLAGDSYGGTFIPMIVSEITKGKEAGYIPDINLQGYLVGNPITNFHAEANSRFVYAHQMGLISDEYYQSAKNSCNGEYTYPDPNNKLCRKYVELIFECCARLNTKNILEKCLVREPKLNELRRGQRFLEDIYIGFQVPPILGDNSCWTPMYDRSIVWANDPIVQQSLHVRNGTKPAWERFNKSLSFDFNVQDAFGYYQLSSMENYRALIYCGDHDLAAPYIVTFSWIKSLNLTTTDDWRPWFTDGQVAGFTQEYKKSEYSLTFATVKGAGHVATETKPMECYAMAERWLSKRQL